MSNVKKTSGIIISILCCLFLCCILLLGIATYVFPPTLSVIKVLPDIMGSHGKKTYLILFQNNQELRPGGGFIGSYGLVSIDHGKIGQISIHNVYDADGQLHKHIEPPYIIRRYLQVHLYMRDSNFDVDFFKSAQKAEYMLKQETGQHVDGAIAIDVSYIKSFIAVVSPLDLWQYHTTVTPNNFFMLTEQHTDQHSFAGSTQKQDFLHALFQSMQDKIQQNKLYYYALFVQKTLDAIKQKHLLFAYNDPDIQEVFTKNNLSSTLYDPRQNKPNTVNDFLGINEANIGVNKANYFLKRSINHHVNIDTFGNIKEAVSISYTNMTKTDTWPSGVYKNYVRVILPLHTQLRTITIDGQIQHIIPAITNPKIYEAPGFHPPAGLEVNTTQEEGKAIYGFVVSVGIKSTKVVTITYQLADRFILSQSPLHYNLYLFKQPGMDNDPYTFSFSYPQVYAATMKGNTKPATQKKNQLIVNTSLLTDQNWDIKMKK